MRQTTAAMYRSRTMVLLFLSMAMMTVGAGPTLRIDGDTTIQQAAPAVETPNLRFRKRASAMRPVRSDVGGGGGGGRRRRLPSEDHVRRRLGDDDANFDNDLLPPPRIPTTITKTNKHSQRPILDPADDEILQTSLHEEQSAEPGAENSSLERVLIVCNPHWTKEQTPQNLDSPVNTAASPPDVTVLPDKCYEALEETTNMSLVAPVHVVSTFSVGDVHTIAAYVHSEDITKIDSINDLTIQEDPQRETLHLPGSFRMVSLADDVREEVSDRAEKQHRSFISNRRLGLTSNIGSFDQVQISQVLEKYHATGSGTSICVIDTGMYEHGDVVGSSIRGTSNPQVVSPWNEDIIRHGTFVTGMLASRSDTLQGIAPDASFYIVRVFRDKRNLFGSDLVAAARLCRSEARSDIINISLGGTKIDREENAYFAELQKEGILVVAASGNTGRPGDGNAPNYPAMYDSVISVGSVDSDGILAPSSTRNEQVNVVAPGVDILSIVPQYNQQNGTYTDGYATWSGTSMAAPYVSGILALLLSNAPYASRDFLVNAIQDTAFRNDNKTRDDGYGYGLIQADAAMDYVLRADCDTAGGQTFMLTPQPQTVETETFDPTTNTTTTVSTEEVSDLDIRWQLLDYRNGRPIAFNSEVTTSSPPQCVSKTRCYHLQVFGVAEFDELVQKVDVRLGSNSIIQSLEVVDDGADIGGITVKLGYCPVIYKEVELRVITDQYGSDIMYRVVRWNPETRQEEGKPVMNVEYTLPNFHDRTEKAEVDSSACWKFELVDSYGDGIIGEGRGIRFSYHSVVYYEGRNFGRGGSLFFGDGC